MNRYITANKLIAEIERYENTAIEVYNPLGEDADFWHGKVVACEDLKTFVASLQQEQPEGGYSEKPNDLLSKQEPTCKTCSYYENDCPFTRGKLMVYPNKVCKDYTHSAMKQEQLGVRCEPSLPSNLDEAAEAYEKYAMEDYDEICVNEDGSECPVLKCDFKGAFKAGAEWMAGQFQKIEGYLVDWYSTSDGKDYCCGIKTDEAFEIPEGFYIQKKQQPGESLKENEDGNK